MDEQQSKQELKQNQPKPLTENEKLIGALAYLVFFLPLLMENKSEFTKFHANQGLLLFLSSLAVWVLGWILPIIGLLLIWPFGSLFVFALFIIGVVNALNGKTEPLPIIGNLATIIK